MGGKKRPCSICRRWFVADPRVRGRQTTCSSAECQQARRARTQRGWREKNPSYQSERRLREQAEKLESSDGESVPLRGLCGEMAEVPWSFGKDAIGSQGVVFMVFFFRLIMRSVKDETCMAPSVITSQIRRHPSGAAKDQTDRIYLACDAPP